MKDKILKEITVSYPIFRIDTRYCCRKVCTPTVFDELLMSLIADFPELKDNNLAEICELLALDEIFINYALQHLTEVEAIENRNVEKNNLENISLSQLVLTDTGKKFYQEKQIPGQLRKYSTLFYFNPLIQQYEPRQDETKNPKKSDNIDIELNKLFALRDETLQNLSLEVLHSEMGPDERLENNRIEHSCEYYIPTMLKIQLILDNNNYVDLRCDNRYFSQWLKEKSADTIQTYILNPILKKASANLSTKTKLAYTQNELLSFVLADQRSDLSKIKNAILIKLSNKEELKYDKPYIILDNQQNESILNENVLIIPNKNNLNFPQNINQIFWVPDNQKIFVEKEGFFDAYFNYQPILLPIRIVTEDTNTWIQNLPALQHPNLDTLAFMANYLPDEEIVAKLPILSITQALAFKEKIAKTWHKKSFAPVSWAEKIELLQSEQDQEKFEKLFPKISLSLVRFDKAMQVLLVDKAIKDRNSKAAKFSELSELLNSLESLKELDSNNLELKSINQEILNKLENWEKIYTKFSITYPEASEATEFLELSLNLTNWKKEVTRVFKSLEHGKKFAVVDTNFIRRKPEQLKKLQEECEVILPSIVIHELDYQKECLKIELKKENSILSQMDIQSLVDKITYFTDRIKENNTEIENLETRLKEKQTRLKAIGKI